MNQLLFVFVAAFVVSTAFGKDEIKDALTKKDQKEQQPSRIGAGAVVAGISCYQCNSATVGEENCVSSDLDALKKFIKPCPPLPEGSTLEEVNGAKSCRKIEQNVLGDPIRIIRECAYTGDEEINGKKRTGNKGIINYFYVCFNEETGEPCNPATKTVFTLGALLVVFVAQLCQRF